MLYISSSWIKNREFFSGLEKILSITNNIELSGGTKYRDDLLKELLNFTGNRSTKYLLHGYFPPSRNERFLLNLSDNSQKTRDFMSKSMEYVYALDVPYYSLHAGFRHSYDVKNSAIYNAQGEFFFEDMLENIDWFCSQFSDKSLAVENLYPVNGLTDCAFCIDPEEIVKLLEADKRIYFLFDLGHLKVSANYLKFDFCKMVNSLIKSYCDRIIEIHLAENNGTGDDHLYVGKDSDQYKIIADNIDVLKKNKVNLVIESRNASFEELKTSYNNIRELAD